MLQNIEHLFAKYQGRGAIVDTNLLLLFVVGACNPERITTFKRTKTFSVDDYALLRRFIESFKVIRTTPSILTEVSNHLGHLPENLRGEHFSAFSACIENLLEIYEPSATLSKDQSFVRFGLTDAAVVNDAKDNHIVLTDDFPLSGYLQSAGVDAINFNHLRMISWYSKGT